MVFRYVAERMSVATPSDGNPYKKELDDMLHDLSVLDGIAELSGQLRLRYEVCCCTIIAS